MRAARPSATSAGGRPRSAAACTAHAAAAAASTDSAAAGSVMPSASSPGRVSGPAQGPDIGLGRIALGGYRLGAADQRGDLAI